MESSSEQMRKYYDQWQSSGLSRMAFCKQEKINYATFNYWHKQFTTDQRSGFSEVTLNPGSEFSTELIFPSGVRLLFPCLPPVAFLKTLIG